MKHAEDYVIPVFVAVVVFLMLSLPVLAFADDYPCLCNDDVMCEVNTSLDEELSPDNDMKEELPSDSDTVHDDEVDSLPVETLPPTCDDNGYTTPSEPSDNEEQGATSVPSQMVTPAIPNVTTPQGYKMYFESLYVLMKQIVYFIPV